MTYRHEDAPAQSDHNRVMHVGDKWVLHDGKVSVSDELHGHLHTFDEVCKVLQARWT